MSRPNALGEYLRAQQGRDRNRSPQVVEALARVSRLDAATTEYLLSLSSARPSPRREVVPAGSASSWM